MLRFKLAGFPVTVDFLFVGTVTLFLLTDRSGISAMALLACFVHETGHLLAFLLVGYTPRGIVFELTGIRLIKPEQELCPGREAIVQAAGSAVNFAVFFLLSGSLGGISHKSLFAVTHLLLGCFQLLPLSSLDGGKLLALAAGRLWGERAAYRIGTAADFLTLAGLLAGCIWGICSRGGMAVWFLLAMLLIALAARIRQWGR